MANTISSGSEKRGSEWKVRSAAIAMIRHFLSRVQRTIREAMWRQMLAAKCKQASNKQRKRAKGVLGCVETKVFCFFM